MQEQSPISTPALNRTTPSWSISISLCGVDIYPGAFKPYPDGHDKRDDLGIEELRRIAKAGESGRRSFRSGAMHGRRVRGRVSNQVG